MNEPVKVREHWVVLIDGKKRKFKTEDEAWEAVGIPEQLEIEWVIGDETEIEEILKEIEDTSTKKGVIGSFFSSGDSSNS